MLAADTTQPALIKRYAGSRLYDAADCRYVTVEQLRGWARDQIAFRIVDARTGADITGQVMA